MKERAPNMVTRALEAVRGENEDANQQFQESLAEASRLRSGAHELDEHVEHVLAELRVVAGRHDLVLVSDQPGDRDELVSLSLQAIEHRLGVTSDDSDYGRTRYVDVYPRDTPELSAEAQGREQAYDAAVARLRRKYPRRDVTLDSSWGASQEDRRESE